MNKIKNIEAQIDIGRNVLVLIKKEYMHLCINDTSDAWRFIRGTMVYNASCIMCLSDGVCLCPRVSFFLAMGVVETSYVHLCMLI